MAELCRALNALGYDARIQSVYNYPLSKDELTGFYGNYFISCIKQLIRAALLKFFPFTFVRNKLGYADYFPRHFEGCRRQWLPLIKKDSIVLYPEVCYGNPLNAKYVARWLLYHYQYKDDKEAYDSADLFIGYRDVFNDCPQFSGKQNILINVFDSRLYYQYNFGQRTGNCYIIRKGRKRADLPSSFDGPVVDDMTEEDIVKAFNECEYCYSYDTQTFYSSIAAVCGCKSIIVLEPGKTAADYTSGDDNRFGVAYGFDDEEIERAEKTKEQLIESLERFKDQNLVQAQHFVEMIEIYFGVEIKHFKHKCNSHSSGKRTNR